MTQDERWAEQWQRAMDFIALNGRNPSKYVGEEREILTWIKHSRKLMNHGKLKEERRAMFERLLALVEGHRRVNQYT